MSEAEPPWASIRSEISGNKVDAMQMPNSDSFDTKEKCRDYLAKMEWYKRADVEEILLQSDHVLDVEHDTPRDHNIWVVTEYEKMPGEFIDLSYNLDVRSRISMHTDYKVTNTRIWKGQLTLTLAPE